MRGATAALAAAMMMESGDFRAPGPFFSDPGFEERVRAETYARAAARGVDLKQRALDRAEAKRQRKAARRLREVKS